MNLNSDRFVPKKDNKNTFYFEHLQRYDFSARFIKGKIILDLGCGSGYGSRRLLDHKAKSVVAVDIDPKIINFAKKNYPHKKLSFQVANATKLSFRDSKFDVVVSFEVIEHVKDYPKYIQEVLRVLKPKGQFIFSTPNKLKHRANTSAYHFKEFTPLELNKLFRKYPCQFKLFGQFFKSQDFIEAEEEYFKRYNNITFGGNKNIKKLLNIIPSKLKASLYKIFWKPLPQLDFKQIKIQSKNINEAVSLIGVVQKNNEI
ncbi:class I SAM-dependent methyltransferase [Candidatus Daviesbacteria bacterium]|nr:class I SAM-dependent methyltransferase [Candidatus Daviesbacteria bacterium]